MDKETYKIGMRSKFMNSFDLAGSIKKTYMGYIDNVFWIICIIYYTVKTVSR